LHAGLGGKLPLGGVKLPIALRKSPLDGAFGGFVSFFVEVDAAAVAAVKLDELAAGNGAIAAVEDEFHLTLRRLACAQHHLAGEVAVGPTAKNFDGRQGGLVIVPNGVARGLAGAGWELLGVFHGAADGLGGLQALENSVQN